MIGVRTPFNFCFLLRGCSLALLILTQFLRRSTACCLESTYLKFVFTSNVLLDWICFQWNLSFNFEKFLCCGRDIRNNKYQLKCSSLTFLTFRNGTFLISWRGFLQFPCITRGVRTGLKCNKYRVAGRRKSSLPWALTVRSGLRAIFSRSIYRVALFFTNKALCAVGMR